MRFVDWFAGIGGFRLGLERHGFEHAASCELATFPRRVYAERFGEPQTFEDVTRVKAAEIPEADLWCGGFPCQDVSQAGEGRGLLGGARSGLVFRLLGLAAVARPEWILLENVPGLLVRGRGFDRLAGVLARLGYGFCWRRLDAQYFGVAQRRKRIMLLACLDPRAGMQRAAEVLLEPEGMRGDPPTRGAEGSRVAHAITTRPGERHCAEDTIWSERLADPLTASGGGKTYCHAGNNPRTRNVVAYPLDLRNALRENPVIGKGTPGTGVGEGDPSPVTSIAPAVVVIPFSARNITRPDGSRCDPGAPAHTLSADPRPAVAVIPFNAAQVTSPDNRSLCGPGEPAHTLAVSAEPESIAAVDGRFVRRLMPIECERLQGFPDGWTDITGASDAQRYRALGNAVAVPVVEWIAKRLAEAS